MTDLILKQDVKRRQRKHRRSQRAMRETGGGLLRTAGALQSAVPATRSSFRRICGVLRRSGPFIVYASAGVMVIMLVLVLTAGVHSVGLPTGEELSSLPTDTAIGFLVTDYISPGTRSQDDGVLGGPPRPLHTSIEPISYMLRRGDTVSDIALEYDIRLDTIISYNDIIDVRRIYAGEEILVPAVEGEAVNGVKYVVKRGDSLQGIALRFGVPLEPILDLNEIETTVIQPGLELFIPDATMDDFSKRRALGTLFLRPFSARLTRTSGFGMRLDPFTNTNRFHYGVDWAGPVGTPVLASNHGVVVYRNQNSTLGKYVLLKHDRGYQTLYAHLDSWSVRAGQYVQQGQKIGTIGNTGRSTGPHLHFVIYINGKPVDPERIL